MQEAQDALETYRQKDPSKGTHSLGFAVAVAEESSPCSRRAVQGGRECADNEAELLQDHRIESIPGSDSVFEEGAGVEDWGPAGEHAAGTLVCEANLTDPQFTYINLAFSPAPDDTVSNLFKVRIHHRR